MPRTSLDWLGVVSLWVGTILFAIVQARVPLMPGASQVFVSQFWNFAPALLVSLAILIAIYRRLSTARDGVALAPEKLDPDAEKKLEVVAGQQFHNMRVPLDGKNYTGCTFENVTFVYNGGPCRVHGSHIGNNILTSERPELLRLLHVLILMGHLRGNIYTDDGKLTAEEYDAKYTTKRVPASPSQPS